MPELTATDAAAIQAGAQLAGTTANMISAANANKKQREWQSQQYALQRQHALQDWEMQNKYNSPEEQMRRLKQAGLNPNLVYGQGAVANNTTGVRSSNPDSTPMQPVRFDISNIGEAVNTYFNVMTAKQEMTMRSQQIDNLKKQGDILDAEVQIKNNDILNSFLKGEHSKFDLGMKKDSRNYDLDLLKYKLRNSEADLLTKKQNYSQSSQLFPLIQSIKKGQIQQIAAQTARTRQAAMLDLSDAQMKYGLINAQIDNTKQSTENLKRDYTKKTQDIEMMTQIAPWLIESGKMDAYNKSLDAGKNEYNLKNLREFGVQPGDKLWMRILMNLTQ